MRNPPDKKIARLVDFSGTYSVLGKAEDIHVSVRDGMWELLSNKNGVEKRWHARTLYVQKIDEA